MVVDDLVFDTSVGINSLQSHLSPGLLKLKGEAMHILKPRQLFGKGELGPLAQSGDFRAFKGKVLPWISGRGQRGQRLNHNSPLIVFNRSRSSRSFLLPASNFNFTKSS